MKIGEKIYLLRKNKNLTQEQLADLLSISTAAISKWETGNAFPDISLLPSIANIFNISIDYLFDYEIETKSNVLVSINEAKEMFANGKSMEASNFLKEALIRYPNNIELIFELAKIQFISAVYLNKIDKEKNLKEAESGFITITKRDCSNELKVLAYHYLSTISLYFGEIDKAVFYNNQIILPKDIYPAVSKIGIKTRRNDSDTIEYIIKSINEDIISYCLKVNWLINNLLQNKEYTILKESVHKLINIIKIYTNDEHSELDLQLSELYETLAYIDALLNNYESSIEMLAQSANYIIRYEPFDHGLKQRKKLLDVIKCNERKLYEKLNPNFFENIINKLTT